MRRRGLFIPMLALAIPFIAGPRASHAVSFWDGFWECEGTYHGASSRCEGDAVLCVLDRIDQHLPTGQCAIDLSVCKFNSEGNWATCIGSLNSDPPPLPPRCGDALERFTSCIDFMHVCPEQVGLDPDSQQWCNLGENACYTFEASECL